MTDFAAARRLMVDAQLRTFDVNDLRLLAAFDSVPREVFVHPRDVSLAYTDGALSVDGSRAMLRPLLLGRILQDLSIVSGARMLDVAGGTGYASAIAHALGATVTLLEDDAVLAARAKECLAAAGAAGVNVAVGPLDQGCAQDPPFDVILINGAVDREPATLLEQLAPGGRLGCFVRIARGGRAAIYLREAGGVSRRNLFEGTAPPLAAFAARPEFVF